MIKISESNGNFIEACIIMKCKVESCRYHSACL